MRKHYKFRLRQRGIFGSLFGGTKNKQKSETDAKREATTTSERDATKQQQGTTTTAGEQRTQLLEDPIRQAANTLVLSLVEQAVGPDGSQADIARIAKVLEDRANEAEAAQKSANVATLAAARREGERQVTRLNTDLATAAGGSTLNSFVAGATAEATAQLETSLAALEADLGIQARNLGTQEMMMAVEAFKAAQVAGSGDANAISQLIGVLRGANSTTTTNETQNIDVTETLNEQAVETLNEIVKELTKGTAKENKSLFSQIGLSF